NLHMGDFVNLAIKLDVHTDNLVFPALGFPPEIDPVVVAGKLLDCITSAGTKSEACAGVLHTLPNLLKAGELCEDPLYKNQIVCQVVDGLLGGGSGGSAAPAPNSGSGSTPGATPTIPSNPLEKLVEDLGLLGLPGLKLN